MEMVVSEAIKGVPHELKMKIVGTEDFDALKPLEINARAAYDINPLKKAEWDEVGLHRGHEER